MIELYVRLYVIDRAPGGVARVVDTRPGPCWIAASTDVPVGECMRCFGYENDGPPGEYLVASAWLDRFPLRRLG